jgi:hypothetical protein
MGDTEVNRILCFCSGLLGGFLGVVITRSYSIKRADDMTAAIQDKFYDAQERAFRAQLREERALTNADPPSWHEVERLEFDAYVRGLLAGSHGRRQLK